MRRRLMLALGFLTILVIAVAATALWGITQIRVASRQAVVVDGRMSRLASEIAIQALLCRRYEKDYFLRFGDRGRQAESLALWQQASADLEQTIATFAAHAQSEDDRRQAVLWQAARGFYAEGFRTIERAVNEGRLTTPGEADRAAEAYRENIYSLTDLAVLKADAKRQTAEATAEALDARSRATIWGVLIVAVAAVAVALAWTILFPAWLVRPLDALRTAAQRLTDGDFGARVGLARGDELGMLAASFDRMAETIQQRTADLEAQYQSAETARHTAEEAQAQIADQLATIAGQRAQIGEMSVPILPLADGTLVLPLVGALDSARLSLTQERALHAIEEMRAKQLILDITGVPVVDTQVAQGLIEIVQAARLLGANVVLVGIRPEVAQAIVGLGISLQGIVTQSTLQAGISYALRRA